MTKIYVTSDTHFYHANIIKYTNRPFKDVDEMNEGLIKRWNDKVTKDDIMFFLGDFIFAKPDKMAYILGRLNFKEMNIVPGNHDHQFVKWLKTTPYPNVKVVNKIYELRVDTVDFVLCHFPIEEWDRGIHLHGHTHGNIAHRGTTIKDNRYDIGVDVYGGPVLVDGSLKEILNPKGWN